MLTDPSYQRKNILRLIKHKSLVSSEYATLALHLSELKDFPDHETILDDFELQRAIRIQQHPDFKEFLDLHEELPPEELDSLDYQLKYEYVFYLENGFDDYYSDVVGADKFSNYALHEDDLQLKTSSYNGTTGVLALTPFMDFDLSHNKQKPAKEQKAFLARFFKNKDALELGLTYYQLAVTSRSNSVNEKILKKYTNSQTQINKKFKEVTGLKNLIIYKNKIFRINPRYLEKN